MDVRTLSRLESKVVLTLEAKGRDVVSLSEIESLTGISRPHARKLAHILGRKGWLQRLGGGRYLLNPGWHGPDALPDTDALRIGRQLLDQYYFAYSTAANLHGFLGQVSRVYTLATPSRGGLRRLGPVDFRLVHLGSRRFFGKQSVSLRGLDVFVSDPEKTVLDCLDRTELAGGISSAVQVVSRAASRLDYPRLWRYLSRWSAPPMAHRLGLILSRRSEGARAPDWFLRRLRAIPRPAVVPIAPPSRYGTKGRIDRDWNVLLNVPESELFGEVGVR